MIEHETHAESHVHFVDGHLEPTIEFDYDAVDRGNPLTAELERTDAPENAAEAFEKLLAWCWHTEQHGTRTPEKAYMRFVAMCAVVNPGWFGDASYLAIGEQLGVGKATISQIATNFQEQFGVHFRRSRPESVCQKFRELRQGKKKA